MKNKEEFRALAICLIIVGVVFIIMSATMKIPDDYLNYNSDVYKYVGGDAYNYIIEAQFRANEISTAKIIQAIYLVAGIAFLAIGVGVNVATFIQNKEKQSKSQCAVIEPSIVKETVISAKPEPAVEKISTNVIVEEKSKKIEKEKPIVIQPTQEEVKMEAVDLLFTVSKIQDREQFYFELSKWQDKYGSRLIYWDLKLYNKISNFFNDVSYTSTYDNDMRESRTYNIEDEDFISIVSAIKEFCESV